MKPLLLNGHERSVQKIKFNREGDLLLSTAKDKEPSIWWTINGERLGTLKGHNGVVWCVDIDWESKKIVTGSGDFSARLWDCETGKSEEEWKYMSSAKHCSFSYSGNLVCITTSKQGGGDAALKIHDLRDRSTHCPQGKDGEETSTLFDFPLEPTKYASALWAPNDTMIYFGTTDGRLSLFDLRKQNVVESVQHHKSQIQDIQMSKDYSFVITASSDTSAKLFHSRSLEHLKTYQTERPVNSASVSPLRRHVLLGGGQEAMQVTQTATESGKFEARLFHMIFEEEFARVGGHFGPINTVAFHPDGKGYASGAEDGYIRLHRFDQDYFEFHMDGDTDN